MFFLLNNDSFERIPGGALGVKILIQIVSHESKSLLPGHSQGYVVRGSRVVKWYHEMFMLNPASRTVIFKMSISDLII